MNGTAKIYDTPLYNSRIIDNYIKLIKKQYEHIDIHDLLAYSDMKPYEVSDQGHWFTQKQINRFHEKLSQLTQNKNIAREAGRFGASPESSGVMRQFFLGMVGPAAAYDMISKGATNFTRSSTYQSKRLGTNKVEITVSPHPGCTEKPFQCENRTGYLEAIAMMFDNKLPKVEHEECIFKSGKSCRYTITWEKSLSDHLKSIRNVLTLGLVPVVLTTILFHPFNLLFNIILAAVITLLMVNFFADMHVINELKTSLNNLKYASDQLVEQININYNNAILTNEIGQAISQQISNKEILFKFIKIFKNRLQYDRCMILLADKNNKRLRFRSGYGYTESQLKLLKNTYFHLDRPDSKGVFVVAFKNQESFLINDIKEIESSLSKSSIAFAKKLDTHSFVCCPIIADGKSVGILAVDNLKSKKPLVQSDLSLLTGIASVLGVSIKNANLVDAREKQFRSILHALAASIDARDPMTSGHSEKVTEYALGICDELGLSKDYCEMIRVAALLHDYGKIGIPDTILKKPGRLTDEEFEIVKTHSEKTRRILEQINFEGIYSQVPEIAGSHHEKIDGSGYPDGLKFGEIPLGARIIAVADFFEAITARRHYRGPMPLQKAFTLLVEERSRRFDPDVVDAFCRYYARIHAGQPEYRALAM